MINFKRIPNVSSETYSTYIGKKYCTIFKKSNSCFILEIKSIKKRELEFTGSFSSFNEAKIALENYMVGGESCSIRANVNLSPKAKSAITSSLMSIPLSFIDENFCWYAYSVYNIKENLALDKSFKKKFNENDLLIISLISEKYVFI